MTLQTQRLTYDEYLKSPEIKQRREIVDGLIIMAPGPTFDHQMLLRQLFRLLDRYVVERGLGEVIFAPVDVLIQREPLRVRQPDLLFISNERSSAIHYQIEGPPDLVAEILSPSNTRSLMEEKLADYAKLGVRECWLVSPEARTVEVLEGADDGWRRLGLHGLGDEVSSRVFEGLALPVVNIFQ